MMRIACVRLYIGSKSGSERVSQLLRSIITIRSTWDGNWAVNKRTQVVGGENGQNTARLRRAIFAMLGAGAGASTEALLRSVVGLVLLVIVVGFGEVGRGMAMLTVFGDRRRNTKLVVSSFLKALVVVPLPLGTSPQKGTEQHRQHLSKHERELPSPVQDFYNAMEAEKLYAASRSRSCTSLTRKQ